MTDTKTHPPRVLYDYQEWPLALRGEHHGLWLMVKGQIYHRETTTSGEWKPWRKESGR